MKKRSKQQAYHLRKPWVKHVCWARRRCSSSDPRWAPHYLERGISCNLTAAEAEMLWVRDNAGCQPVFQYRILSIVPENLPTCDWNDR